MPKCHFYVFELKHASVLIPHVPVYCLWLGGGGRRVSLNPLHAAPSLYGELASSFIGILKVTLKAVLCYWCMHVSSIPGGQEKICGLWTDTIVAYRIVLCDPAGERHVDEKTVEECWWAPTRTQAKTHEGYCDLDEHTEGWAAWG